MSPERGELRASPDRVLADLRELAALTADERGAQRVVWTPRWDAARDWLRRRLAAIGAPVQVTTDRIDNLWAELEGAPEGPVVAIGSHLDSVPDGGWLDGALGVVAGLEMLRCAAESGWSGARLRLIDWADEEGRFGHSLLGSTAATKGLEAGLGERRDRDGSSLAAVLAERGLDLSGRGPDGGILAGVDALLELHIEQGPRLELADAAIGAPSGSVAVHRAEHTFEGAAAHAGTTPFEARRDAGLSAARLALAAREEAAARGGLATAGRIVLEPGVATAVAARATLTLDLRDPSDAGMERLVEAISGRAEQIAREERTEHRETPIWSFAAVEFDPRLVELARSACGDAPALVSGALHDAVATAAAGVPTGMIFVRSLGGISHSRDEQSRDADIAAGVEALAETVSRAAVIRGSRSR